MIRGPPTPVRDVSKILTLNAPQFLEKSTSLTLARRPTMTLFDKVVEAESEH
jgi:hypothetical protein